MEIPKMLREQIKFYERHGFHVVDVEYREGSHMKATFAEFPQPQFLTISRTDWRGWKNNIARYRRLTKEQQENVKSI